MRGIGVVACRLAMEAVAADYQVLNVGSGRALSVIEVAEALARELGWGYGFEIAQQFRAGDIRHCYADLTRIQGLLGYRPRVAFADGVGELVAWVARQEGVRNSVAEATQALTSRGLAR